MQATISCYTCGENLKPSKNTPHALFGGNHEPLCHDCGEGIRIGAMELRANGVSGECVADVPDNQPQLKPAKP